MEVGLITCYIGRSRYIKRILASFLAQDYEGHITLLLYHNGCATHELGKFDIPNNRKIILINNCKDLTTNNSYTSTGAIFRDALSLLPKVDVVNFFDSDDLFLPNHVSEGVKGYLEGGKLAYKPKYSYHTYLDSFSLEENNMEPSVFVSYDHLKFMGFAEVSASYHQKWLTPLQTSKTIYDKEDGIPTFLYDWTRGHNTYKISGAGDDSEINFQNHRNWESSIIEETILTPISGEELNKEYEKIRDNILCNK